MSTPKITVIPDPCWTAEGEAAATAWLALLDQVKADGQDHAAPASR